SILFIFNHPANTVIYTLSLHDALPILTVETEAKYSGYIAQQERQIDRLRNSERRQIPGDFAFRTIPGISREVGEKLERVRPELRSEEHTSELQSRRDLVCRLLLEKKKK